MTPMILGRLGVCMSTLSILITSGALRVTTGFSRSSSLRSFTKPSRWIKTPTSRGSAPSSYATARTMSTAMDSNPLLKDWSSRPFSLPPFQEIETSHYAPALEVAMKTHMEELQAIVDNPDAPTFHNVIQAYDQAGFLLSKVSAVFSNMCSSQNTKELQLVQTEQTPLLSRHDSQTFTLPGLFDKIDQVYQSLQQGQEGSLTPEQIRLVERFHLDFRRAGAHLDGPAQNELTEIKAQLATLQTRFQQNVLEDESKYELVIRRDDLEGCPDSLVEAAKQATIERNKGPDDHVITLSRSLVEPFLVFCPNRELRKTAMEAWTSRGEMDPSRDNLALAKEMLQLRQRQAKLYGYKSYAEFQCADRMAQTPGNVMKLLEDVWGRAKASAKAERLALEAYVEEAGLNLPGGIQPWDWRYVAEKVRKAKYDFDERLLKPYLSLDQVREAMFAVSGNLFGLQYIARPDLKLYHPDVDAYEVRRATKGSQGEDKEDNSDTELVAIFLHDNYSRQFKGSGAWMSEYRTQTKNLAPGLDSIQGTPIVANNNNFAKASGPTLLSHDDARTMFHEFGHAHHGMLSNTTYGRLASTNVLTDFVELPSQLMEHWFSERQVLSAYAKHYETNDSVPTELLDKLEAAEFFNKGFDTIEYTICALLDMAMHQVEDYSNLDLLEFEKKELERLGMPQGIVMRHRPAHFLHLFATDMYAAGYYVYLWAEVLDADAFAAFEETGNVFDPETAEKAYRYIYSAGNSVSPDELFRLFRGRDPDIQFMLEKKGLSGR